MFENEKTHNVNHIIRFFVNYENLIVEEFMFGVLPIIDENVSPKHVIFIAVDAARYGYLERFRTPYLDELINNGVSDECHDIDFSAMTSWTLSI